ncbi:RCC1 domain-containing protein [Archangium violaceum]|uniref:RCC1 domain-containing protein n=1 Tax=Archangium violaceum TaxID=83451 RepID=UPI0036DC69E2
MSRLLGVWLGLWLMVGCGQSAVETEAQTSRASALWGAQARTRIAAGAFHSLVVRPDGTVWVAGQNSSGQLGDGTLSNRTLPVQVQGLSGVVAVSAGSYHHSLAVRLDGTAWAWGLNAAGSSLLPVRVQGMSGGVSVAAGYRHSLAVRSDGTVWAWGDNGYGQLGDGTTSSRTLPVRVP